MFAWKAEELGSLCRRCSVQDTEGFAEATEKIDLILLIIKGLFGSLTPFRSESIEVVRRGTTASGQWRNGESRAVRHVEAA